MAAKKSYNVIFTLDPDGKRWNAEIPGRPGGYGCVTWGRSLSEARSHIVDALATALDDEKAAKEAVLVPTYRVPHENELEKLRQRREVVERSVRELADESAVLARKLIAQGYSMRDTAELVGTSHSRVQQWLESTPTSNKGRIARSKPVTRSRAKKAIAV